MLPPAPSLIRWCNFLLAGLLAVSLAQMTWRLLPAPLLPEPSFIPATETSTPDRTALHLRRIASLHLFGRALSKATRRSIRAPDTPLNLSLRGLVKYGESDMSLAIIADAQGNEAHYRVGDKLPGGAILSEIRIDRVVLLRNGRREILHLPRRFLTKRTASETFGTAVSIAGRP